MVHENKILRSTTNSLPNVKLCTHNNIVNLHDYGLTLFSKANKTKVIESRSRFGNKFFSYKALIFYSARWGHPIRFSFGKCSLSVSNKSKLTLCHDSFRTRKNYIRKLSFLKVHCDTPRSMWAGLTAVAHVTCYTHQWTQKKAKIGKKSIILMPNDARFFFQNMDSINHSKTSVFIISVCENRQIKFKSDDNIKRNLSKSCKTMRQHSFLQ